ncbi:MAG TPA: sugar ABC transporter ATP-binding protein [Solirubrobacterales bacterium]|nr:sugar ABC transporter ATP-binding protein [Solirubrobacterales bacterium]
MVDGVRKTFGGIHAVADVSFAVRPGEVVAIAGENGAGKSTLNKLITGQLTPDAGEVLIDGSHHPRSPAHARRLGVTAVYQEFSLFPHLTVTENVFLFGRRRTGRKLHTKAAAARACAELLERVPGSFGPGTLVSDLSPAEQQLVEVVKALAQDPAVLILDEPTASLNLAERERIHAIVRSLSSQGMSVLYITHHLDEIFELTDRTVVLRDGRLIADVATAELDRRRLEELMVGRTVQAVERPPQPSGEVKLEVRDVVSVRRGAAHPISLDIRAGEIFGLAGLVGSGRTELAHAIVGDGTNSGFVAVDGREIKRRSPSAAKKRGLAFLTEDRRNEGLFLDRSISDNLTVTSLGAVARSPLRILSRRAERRLVEAAIDQLGVRGSADSSKVARSLSGGNQQKLVIGKWLATEPEVFILDEPTRGIDVGAKAEVHQLVLDLAARGKGVLLISSDLPEVLGLSHRVGVMHKGRLAAVLSAEEAEPARVIRYATGGGEGR